MEKNKIHGTIRELLELVEHGRESTEANLLALELLLDRLALGRHYIRAEDTKIDPNDDGSDPVLSKGYAQTRELLTRRFTDFGFYNVVSETTSNLGETELSIGDALDDLTDIILDLEEVAWRWENNGQEDALWHFGFLYQVHWGAHLRSLQWYIHALKNDY